MHESGCEGLTLSIAIHAWLSDICQGIMHEHSAFWHMQPPEVDEQAMAGDLRLVEPKLALMSKAASAMLTGM